MVLGYGVTQSLPEETDLRISKKYLLYTMNRAMSLCIIGGSMAE